MNTTGMLIKQVAVNKICAQRKEKLLEDPNSRGRVSTNFVEMPLVIENKEITEETYLFS